MGKIQRKARQREAQRVVHTMKTDEELLKKKLATKVEAKGEMTRLSFIPRTTDGGAFGGGGVAPGVQRSSWPGEGLAADSRARAPPPPSPKGASRASPGDLRRQRAVLWGRASGARADQFVLGSPPPPVHTPPDGPCHSVGKGLGYGSPFEGEVVGGAAGTH